MGDPVSQRSRALFDSGYYCAESVLSAIAESKGVHTPLIPRIATGFCSGMSRTGGMCGAVSGAIMSISLFRGRDTPAESLDQCYLIIGQFLEQFEKRFGSIGCPQLIGCDLGTPEGQRFFKERNLRERCQQFVEEATDMAMDLLDLDA